MYSDLKRVSQSSDCKKLFKIEKKFHNSIRRYMKTSKKEYGGDTIVNFITGTVSAASVQQGQYDNVDLRRGVIDWHTHPAQCIENGMVCTVGLPSPSDMANIIIGAAYGSMAHMIYSREGTYVILMDSVERNLIRSNVKYKEKKIKKTIYEFDNLYSIFSEKPHERFRSVKKSTINKSYNNFRSEFQRLGKQLGFIVLYFQGNSIPTFYLNFHCDTVIAGPGLTARFKYL
jgi:hypothetical protein